MTDKPVEVAIIGCGRVSGHHCRSIASAPGVKLAAVCDLVVEKAEAAHDGHAAGELHAKLADHDA